MQRALARWGWILPLLALALLLGITLHLDRQNRRGLQEARDAAAAAAEAEASALAEAITAEMAGRIGALAAAKVQFTAVEDSLSQETFLTAVDSVIAGVPGLAAVTVIRPDGTSARSSGALLTRTWREPLTMPEVEPAYRRARFSGDPAATPVLSLLGSDRVVVFDMVPSPEGEARAVLAAELEPLAIVREALEQERDQLRPAFFDVYDPRGTRVTTVPSPEGWHRVARPIRVADTEWRLEVAHQPVSARSFEVIGGAIRISGVVLALAFALSLFLLWRTVSAQQAEIRRRIAAEERASENAAEAARRAAEARAVTDQLSAAQETALRLSASLDPAEVIDVFLGAVGEVLEADLAILYGFDELGDQVMGRRRLVLNPERAPRPTLAEEEFRATRIPIALMPHLAEPIATGEPFLARGPEGSPSGGAVPGVGRPSALLSLPLTLGTHLIGLAVWERYGPDAPIAPSSIPFARAVSAQAAASLRAAELMEGVRRARKRAAREATRLATVLDRLADGVVLFDTEGVPERVNPAAEALLGSRLHDTRLEDWPSGFRVHEEGRPVTGRDFPLLAALRGERVDRARLTIRRHGIERYFAASAAPVRGEDGAVNGVVVVLRDVTDEHEYAEMLRHTNEELRQQALLMERANDELKAATLAKDQFLAMMSHELRTPINAIIGYSDLLDMGVHGTLNDKQREMVSRVVETSRHLLGLINDVLDLTKIAAGRIDLKIDPVPLRPVLTRAANQVSPLADTKGIEVRVDPTPDFTLAADETRLAQILINLAANGVKFTDQGEVVLHAEAQDERVLIHVRDTGPGIPEAEIDRVFEEFHQVDSGHARKAGGTGLGLAISRRLARLMGGDLRVSSVLGEGTDFVLELPLADRGREGMSAGSRGARLAV